MASNSFRALIIRVGGNRRRLRVLYGIWVAFPYPLRRIGTAAFILYVLLLKKLFRVDRQNDLTPTDQLGTLSFWGVPEVDVGTCLQVTGSVDQPIALALEDIKALPSVSRQVRLDCVGGFRNNSIMQGVPLTALFDQVGIKEEAQRAVFHCADGYYSSIDLTDLRDRDAFLAYKVNDEEIPMYGYPLRLAVPGKYGYQWAKWVVSIELVADRRKGHWVALGLPDRGDLGDFW